MSYPFVCCGAVDYVASQSYLIVLDNNLPTLLLP